MQKLRESNYKETKRLKKRTDLSDKIQLLFSKCCLSERKKKLCEDVLMLYIHSFPLLLVPSPSAVTKQGLGLSQIHLISLFLMELNSLMAYTPPVSVAQGITKFNSMCD